MAQRVGMVVDGDDKPMVISCYSRHSVETYSHTWKIMSFKDIPFVPKYPMYSPTFYLGKRGNESSFQVVLTKHMHCINKKKVKTAFSDEGDVESDLESESEDESSFIATEGEEESTEVSSESEVSAERKEEKSPQVSLKSDTDKKPASKESLPVPKEESRSQPVFVKRLGLRLVKIDDNSTWDVVKYSFTLKASDGTTVKTKEREEPGNSDYEGKPIYAFLTEKDFGGIDIFEENKLEVLCHITYYYILGNPHEIPKICEGQKFADDLRLLYNSKKFSDVVLKTHGGDVLSHKNILCARSKGFEKLLEKVADESAPMDRLDLKVDSEVGIAMVHFIYCGKIPEKFPIEKCVGLHEVAVKFGVTGLKKVCSEYLRENLDPEVCTDCLGIHRYTDDCVVAIKELKSEERARIFAKGACVHKSCEMETGD